MKALVELCDALNCVGRHLTGFQKRLIHREPFLLLTGTRKKAGESCNVKRAVTDELSGVTWMLWGQNALQGLPSCSGCKWD